MRGRPVSPRVVRRVGIVGSGLMGREIAQVAAAGGCDVWLADADSAALARARDHIAAIGARRVAKGRMTSQEADAVDQRVQTTSDIGDLAGVDLAIEAVPELLEIKREVFASLDAVLASNTFLASNTSGLSISALAHEVDAPERVLGLHFFNPASVMRLVEVVQGRQTSEEAVAAGEAFATAVGKTPVRVRECPGFLVNRILIRAMAAAYRDTPADPGARAALDAAVVASGPAPMGPFALGDLVGLDTFEHIRGDLAAAYGARYDDGGAAAERCAAGRLGAKSGGGFYDDAAPDATGGGAARRVAGEFYAAAADEARMCRDEAVAAAGDIDVAMRLGCGWELGPLAWTEGRA